MKERPHASSNPHWVLFNLVLLASAFACHRPEPKGDKLDSPVAPTEPKSIPTPAPAQPPAPTIVAEPNPPPGVPAPPDVAAPPGDAVHLATGLTYKVLRPGRSRERPRPWDLVELAYTGWTTDGAMFATTHDRSEPVEMTVDQMIPAWQQTLPQMSVGERRRIWVPEALAAHGAAGMPRGTLVFDLELLEIERRARPPSPPKDIASIPANATRTPSGLACRILHKGRGKLHPAADSRVRIHYDGFTATGTVFESTRRNGMPDTIRITQAIAGMREALLSMVEGEKRRCWIPAALGYAQRTDGPTGDIVVDVELLALVPDAGSPAATHDVKPR